MEHDPHSPEAIRQKLAEQRSRVFVNDERTVLVDVWPSGVVTVATRTRPDEIWGPPVYLKEEK